MDTPPIDYQEVYMFITRVIPALMVGSLMVSSAFAATPATSSASSALTKDQVTAIQKECSKSNGGSMSSDAYKSCVKTKEDATLSKAGHKK
jgi:hypothetical protein